MKLLLMLVSMLMAGIGLGSYITCAILYSSSSPFDVMKREGVEKAQNVRTIFWITLIVTAITITLSSMVK